MLTEEMAKRRIAFVIEEAKHGIRVKDQAITYALRVASNFYSTGKDPGSKGVKKLCRLMSRAALDLFQRMSFDDWHNETTNEHWLPINKIWIDICAHSSSITIDAVVNEMKAYGMVVVTYDENRRLPRDANLSPEARYEAAGIEVMEKMPDGSWIPFQRANSASSSRSFCASSPA